MLIFFAFSAAFHVALLLRLFRLPPPYDTLGFLIDCCHISLRSLILLFFYAISSIFLSLRRCRYLCFSMLLMSPLLPLPLLMLLFRLRRPLMLTPLRHCRDDFVHIPSSLYFLYFRYAVTMRHASHAVFAAVFFMITPPSQDDDAAIRCAYFLRFPFFADAAD